MSVDQLYQQLILDYSKAPNKKDLKSANFFERGHNPSCGDDLSLMLEIDKDMVVDASFVGNGCAISTASTNMLIELIKGKDIEHAKQVVDAFFKMMNNEGLDEAQEELLGDAMILEMTSNMPARIKCATLSWHSLKVILNDINK